MNLTDSILAIRKDIAAITDALTNLTKGDSMTPEQIQALAKATSDIAALDQRVAGFETSISELMSTVGAGVTQSMLAEHVSSALKDFATIGELEARIGPVRDAQAAFVARDELPTAVSTAVSGATDALTQALAKEVLDRTAADKALQDQIGDPGALGGPLPEFVP